MNLEQVPESLNPVAALIVTFFVFLTGITWKLLTKFFPVACRIFAKEIKQNLLRETNADLQEIKKNLEIYKNEKHEIEGENLLLKDIIKIDDQEIRLQVLQIFEKQHQDKQNQKLKK